MPRKVLWSSAYGIMLNFGHVNMELHALTNSKQKNQQNISSLTSTNEIKTPK